jgi:hypothetical protein
MGDTILIAVVCLTLILGISGMVLATLGKINIGVPREVVVGASSSLLAALIIWSSSIIISNVVLPWHYRHSYKGLDLSGKWRITLTSDKGTISSNLDITAEIKQVSEGVSGVLVATFKDGSRKFPLNYAITGVRRDQFLAMTIEKVSRKEIGIATSLTEVTNTGDQLRGYICLYEAPPPPGKIQCYQSEWTRVDDDN